jgi:hypothetical protein
LILKEIKNIAGKILNFLVRPTLQLGHCPLRVNKALFLEQFDCVSG